MQVRQRGRSNQLKQPFHRFAENANDRSCHQPQTHRNLKGSASGFCLD